MRAGELRHQMTIQAPIGVLHETESVDVDSLVPMKIDVLPLAFQARENLALGGPQTQTVYTVTCRYRTDIKPAYVLKEECCTERTFQILAVIPSDRRDALDMTCVTSG
jgi:head-tail adaptor